MKILITGGEGLIGSRLTRLLLNAGHEVTTYDATKHFAKKGDYQKNLTLRHKLFLTGANIVRGDIRDASFFRETLLTYQPEVVVHLAAIPLFNPRFPYDADMWSINFEATKKIAKICSVYPSIRRFIYTSSSMAYGNFTQFPQFENVSLQPLNSYGASKACGELVTRQIFTQAQKEWIIIRPSSVYGETDCNNRVIQKFVEAGFDGEKSIIATKGELLDFTYVEDVALGFYLAITSEVKNEVFNITAGHEYGVLEAAQFVKERYPNLSIELQDSPNDGDRPKRGTLDISKANKMLGYQPMFTLKDGINKYIDFLESNR